MAEPWSGVSSVKKYLHVTRKLKRNPALERWEQLRLGVNLLAMEECSRVIGL